MQSVEPRKWQDDRDSPYSRNPTGTGSTGLTLLVAGCRGGKSSFLRLLVDTSAISADAPPEQIQALAKFIQASNAPTSNIRTVDFTVSTDSGQDLTLTLIDTPALDAQDEAHNARVVLEMLHSIESRLAQGEDEEWTAKNGDPYVHLCIYFLDPDQIVPPPCPIPVLPRSRADSFSQGDSELTLEPPLPSNPLLHRPSLPQSEIQTIRRLSSRVNVLPVIARADLLCNERLAAVKMAVRRDLALNGIGFGIFDIDHHPGADREYSNGTSNGTSKSPPNSPSLSSPLLRLPYALISPDAYSHSDGVHRIPVSRHELAVQYTPSPTSASKQKQRKYTRSYRWGTIDILDPSHSDFVPLRTAIFHHMKTLQKYTREYLFDKFRIECLPQRSSSRHLPHLTSLRLSSSVSHGTRPILAIDTAPENAGPVVGRRHSLREITIGDVHPSRNESATAPVMARGPAPGSATMGRQRSKKITVACNFCRSRKLKCDGGRPSCSQCVKRSHPCDYMVQNRRRTTVPLSKGDESDSAESVEEGLIENADQSLSPEVVPRRNLSPLLDRRDELPPIATVSRRSLDNELPHITTLSLPDTSPSTPGQISAPSLPPILPASEQQAAQRKRAATASGKPARLPTTSGPKVVACNHCRARKTKCDGIHPSCSSCTRRNLSCTYLHDSNGKKPNRRTSQPSASPPPLLPDDGPDDHKRPVDHLDTSRPPKKMKMSMGGSP
ncbi:unnamed protein product [Mycena citricolor]|uniref:GTP binding protein n=1 Tax=Mycena citricolor TaxID=2018698 RepID=A0AAD2JZG9_9AGAR|nr:unnamed protein product [Mycena citricolor]